MFENFKGLLIKETIWLNALRSICAGIVWMILSFFMPSDANSPFYVKLFFPIAVPVLFLMFLVIAQILKMFNMEGIGNILCMFFTVPGDPLLYILFKAKPELVPVKSLNIFNFVSLILVYKDKPSIPNTQPTNENKGSTCPFAGRVIADKEVKAMSFTWPIKATIFVIDDDWKVSSKDSSFGWIDKNGQIREGLKGDPEATLSLGKIVGKIINNGLYVNNEKVGDLVKY